MLPLHGTTLCDTLAWPLSALSALQIRNEQLSNIVHKVQGECDFVLKQASTAAEKQETLAAQLAKLTKSLEQTEDEIRKSQQEAKVTHAVIGHTPALHRSTHWTAALAAP